MEYYTQRHNEAPEFSGYNEASGPLRQRVLDTISRYVWASPSLDPYGPPSSIEPDDMVAEVRMLFPGGSWHLLIQDGAPHEFFSIVEVFLHLASELIGVVSVKAKGEIQRAFQLSGSVYEVSGDRVTLKLSEDLGAKVERARGALQQHQEYLNRFSGAVAALIRRSDSADNLIKDIYISLEGYLKAVTGAGDFGDSIKKLVNEGAINALQAEVLKKIHGYRSRVPGAGHAGNLPPPTERDVVWFLETVVAQVNCINSTFKP